VDSEINLQQAGMKDLTTSQTCCCCTLWNFRV